MEQWVLIRGADTTNPVLLRLHGGPGAAEMPLVRRYNGELEEHFVVVAWDQRGAGKSNRRGFDEASMTLEQFLQDAHEHTRHLKARFGQERIYLLGHSWGTQLGIRLAARHPEDYWAWVGLAQLVNQERGSGPMWNAPDYRDHDLFRGVPRLDVPAYFFAGRRDFNTPLALVQEYAELLEAPEGKEVVVFEASAHTPFLAEPDRFREAMLRVREETWAPERRGARVADGLAPGEPAPLRTDRVILPFLFYAPETKLGGGAVVAGYRRLAPNLPASSALVAATVTARRQLSLDAETEIHGRGGGRVDASAGFSHFPDRFFGVGPDTPDEAEEAFTSRKLDLRLRVQRPLYPGLRVGPQAFGEFGQVAPRLGELTSGRPERSAGAGLRFRLGQDAARIRVDYAVGRKGSGLYLTLGEAF
jgi:pimeloyl-ACP methyl ester carboxylesterase